MTRLAYAHCPVCRKPTGLNGPFSTVHSVHTAHLPLCEIAELLHKRHVCERCQTPFALVAHTLTNTVVMKESTVSQEGM